MIIARLHAFALALVLALATGPALSASADPAPLSPQDQADVAKVQQYLDGIHTLRSDFIQEANDGSLARGTFVLSRPGRMRLQYDPPNGNFIVSDGWIIHYWDAELKQENSAPLGSTLADILLRDKIRLSGDVTVTAVDHDRGRLAVTLIETKEPGKGSLTLVFEDKPLQLKQWRVVDAEGLTTVVALLDPQFDVAIAPSQFVFRAPEQNPLTRHNN